MILYEYPFNERIRTYLRLEHLFGRLGQLMPRDAPLDHHFALITLFEAMDVCARADLKSDVLKDLDKQKSHLASYRGNPAVSEASLETMLASLDEAFTQLSQQHGKPGHELTDNEWLMAIRSRAVIPGGTCGFDLPAYHAWQQHPAERRRADLAGWRATLAPLQQALALLVGLLRDSGRAQRMIAPGGQYQQSLPQGRLHQLLRVRVDEGIVPEISGHRLLVSIRFMRPDADGRLRPVGADTAFDLTLCS